MRVLALVSDAFGGRGGIAKFNRDMLGALCAHPEVTEVVAIPRIMPDAAGALPERLTYRTEGLGGKLAFARTVLGCVASDCAFDVVVCGHINLLPLAYAASRMSKAPLLLVVYGIDAWQPTRNVLVDRMVRGVDAFVSVSEFTTSRFSSWTCLDRARGHLIPPIADTITFTPGRKPKYLLDRYGLEGRTVLLTVARLSAAERYKGHDQVLAALPALAHAHSDVSYLIVGTGNDEARLRMRAQWLGVHDRVVFAGYVPEAEKADHYRVADAFVMPGKGEGFGIVYLEALASGIPVVASVADASREPLLDGEMGHLADPDDAADVRTKLDAVLRDRRGYVPPQLAHFSVMRFRSRWMSVLSDVVRSASGAPDLIEVGGS